MICAAFFHREERLCVCIQGHAGFAPAGKDIVCAGASALALTLASCLRQEEKKGRLRFLSVHQKPGWLEMQVTPNLFGFERLLALLQGAEEGFRLLAQQYPEYVKLESEWGNTPQE